jgi:hypothetical protein
MKGDDRVRDCSQCKLSVYNLSAMSRQEAEALIREREGNLCVRLYQRFDGTVITDDCPLALRKIRDSVRLAVRIVIAIFSLLLNLSPVRAQGTSHIMGRVQAHPNSSEASPQVLWGSGTRPPVPGNEAQAPPGYSLPVRQGTAPKAVVHSYNWPKHPVKSISETAAPAQQQSMPNKTTETKKH